MYEIQKALDEESGCTPARSDGQAVLTSGARLPIPKLKGDFMHPGRYHYALIPTRGQERVPATTCGPGRSPHRLASLSGWSPASRAGEARSTDLCAETRTAVRRTRFRRRRRLRGNPLPRPAPLRRRRAAVPQAGQPGHVTARPRDLSVSSLPLSRPTPPVLSGFRSRSRKALGPRALSLAAAPNKVFEFKGAFFF